MFSELSSSHFRAKSIETDMKTVNSSLELTYKFNRVSILYNFSFVVAEASLDNILTRVYKRGKYRYH
jgi:hypothetical protein